MSERLIGRVALVTGAASGIGRACAQRLASEGAAVLVCDIQESAGKEAASQIAATGARAEYVRLDVTDEESWIRAVDVARQAFGALHILLNNAGVGRPAPITEMTLESWRFQFAVNLDAHFLGMKHSIPLMTETGGGSIINVSSAAGMKTYANMSAYCASKGGVRHLTKVAAVECAQNKTGIRVNSIHPGIIKTPAWDHLDSMIEGANHKTKLLLIDFVLQQKVKYDYTKDSLLKKALNKDTSCFYIYALLILYVLFMHL